MDGEWCRIHECWIQEVQDSCVQDHVGVVGKEKPRLGPGLAENGARRIEDCTRFEWYWRFSVRILLPGNACEYYAIPDFECLCTTLFVDQLAIWSTNCRPSVITDPERRTLRRHGSRNLIRLQQAPIICYRLLQMQAVSRLRRNQSRQKDSCRTRQVRKSLNSASQC